MTEDYSALKTAVLSLKEEFQDHRASQLKINAHIQSHLDIYQLREKQLKWSLKSIKYLLNKIKEFDIRVDTLLKLFGGKLEHFECKCGEKISFFNVEDKKNATPETFIDTTTNDSSFMNNESDEKAFASQDCQTEDFNIAQHEREFENEKVFVSQECQTAEPGHNKNEITEDDAVCLHQSRGCQTPISEIDVYSSECLLYYNDNDSRRIFVLLPNNTWVFECDDTGKHFQRGVTLETKIWRDIIDGFKQNKCRIAGQFIQCTEKFRHMIFKICLCSLNRNLFTVRIHAVNNQKNAAITLPIYLRLIVNIEKMDGSFSEHSHNFKIDDLYPRNGQPNNFNIPLIDLSRYHRPKMIIKIVEQF